MTENLDYLSTQEREKIIQISKKNNEYLYQIGQRCEVKDKAYWSRIMNKKKPIPEHVRAAINRMFKEEAVI